MLACVGPRKALNGGCDMECPNTPFLQKYTSQAVSEHLVNTSTVDTAIIRKLQHFIGGWIEAI